MKFDECLKEYASLHKVVHDFELLSYKNYIFFDAKTDIVRGHRIRKQNGSFILQEDLAHPENWKAMPNNRHQFRTRKKTKDELIQRFPDSLLYSENYKTFEDIHSSVRTELGPLSDLLTYDIALRIGAINGILPENKVYLHAGALLGAEVIKREIYPLLPIKRPCVDISEIKDVVKEFKDFSAYDIEHFLCVFHKKLGGYSEE